MKVSVMECPQHGRQGLITLAQGRWYIKLDDGAEITGRGDRPDRQVLCRRCEQALGYWQTN
jgi:hypothetical protein